MSDPPNILTFALSVKLGALVVHADEATSIEAHAFDAAAMRSLVDDPEVQDWLGRFAPGLLPVKRRIQEEKDDA